MKTKTALLALTFVWLYGCTGPHSYIKNGGQAPAQRVYACPNRQYLPALEKLIKSAENTLYFHELYFHEDETTGKLIPLLNDAVNRGVDVRFMLEDSISYNPSSVSGLRALGIEAKLDGKEIFSHAKFAVADGERTIVGSTNLSETSIERNNETDVFINDKNIGAWFDDYFLAAWGGTGYPPSVISGAVKTILPGGLSDVFVSLFSSATARIHLLIYGIKIYPGEPENPVMRASAALFAAAKRGVDVQVIFELSDYNDTLNKMTAEAKKYFEENGVKTFYENVHTITHAKLTIADGNVVVGSSNWGYGGFNLYREANVLIKDPKLADRFEKYFQKVKNTGK